MRSGPAHLADRDAVRDVRLIDRRRRTVEEEQETDNGKKARNAS
jgi:hypothetical protein